MKKLGILNFIFCLSVNSCLNIKNVPGIYRSNFAVDGFFITRIKISNKDSFQYSLRGDLIYDTAIGLYKIDKNKLILSYKPIAVDTSKYTYFRSLSFKPGDNIINYRNLPAVFYIRKDKLFTSNKDGKIVRTAKAYFKNKNFKKKYYLKRVS